MDAVLPTNLLREGLVLLATVGGPMFGALLVSGLVVGVLQSATQVQDPAVGFLPRIVVACGMGYALGPWMVERLAMFLTDALTRMAVHPF